MSAKSMQEILDLGDDEFAQTSAPPDETVPTEPVVEEKKPEETPAQDEQPETPEQPVATEETTETEQQPVEEQPKADEKPAEKPAKPEEKKNETSGVETDEEFEKKGKDAFADDGKAPTPEKKPEAKPEAKKPEEQKTPDASKAGVDAAQFATYKAFYERIMAPIKANGTMIQLQSADEVVQLIQMGANYTKKMQELQPQKKLVMMLQNNGINEEKLNFLIDLDKKDPEAIKKLLKDAKIDPVDLDTTKVNYRGGSHGVTDQEAALTLAIEEITAQDGGRETLQSINQTWDAPSKKFLWENPDLLKTIHIQRQNGIYAKVTAEVERRRTLGQIGPTVSFLQAYNTVGNELAARGAFQPQPKPEPAPKPGTVAPVAVRPGKAPAPKADDNRVRAAAPTRTAPKPAQVSTNYLAMSDEEFEKQKPPN